MSVARNSLALCLLLTGLLPAGHAAAQDTAPATMTLDSIAAVIDEGRDRDLGRTLERLATLTAQVSRTQLVAIAGNVLVALPTSLLIAWAWLMAAGVPVTSTDKAAHLLADLHPWASAALPHAAIAGVCLFLAGIIAGYQDNRCVYARLPARIARHPGLHRLIGPSRSALLAIIRSGSASAIARPRRPASSGSWARSRSSPVR